MDVNNQAVRPRIDTPYLSAHGLPYVGALP